MAKQRHPKLPEVDKIASELKGAGVVIPLDFGLPGKVVAELSKRGVDIDPMKEDWGGLAFSHVFLVWRH